ncbi:hypothetical protein BVX97_05020 [bacterium E08(2017)]|nr:hypothetical protein BVX97_05020 [bacterium E08(2017)]
MRTAALILLSLSLIGCAEKKDVPAEEKSKPGAAQQAVDRMTGKTAIEAHKQAKDVLGDVQRTTDERAKDLKDFKKD